MLESACLPFSDIPHTTRLFADYISYSSKVRQFFPRPPLISNWLAEEARAIDYPAERRAQVAAILERQNRKWGASAKTLENIERLRRGSLAAVTGQQVGLFGGPLFSLFKALSAIAIAEQSTQAGFDCVPVFWIATEDHDWDEVSHVKLPTGEGGLETLTTPTTVRENAPVYEARFGEEIGPVVETALRLLGDSDVSDLLRQIYQPGVTIGDAFARLFSKLFADYGVILLDPFDAELHAIAKPLLTAAIERSSELTSVLLERGKELTSAGYHEQVKVTSTSTLLFAIRDGQRIPIHAVNGSFSIAGQKFSRDELLAQIEAAPLNFSPNVLLRPVVQDWLLPTLAYNGGSAEIAYFAQAGVVYEKLLGRVTPALPRFSATLVEPWTKRLLEKYGLSLPELFHCPERLQELLAKRSLPPELQQEFDKSAAAVEDSLQRLSAVLQKLDPTLVDSAGGAHSKMTYQLEQLRGKAARAELRRAEVLERHARQLSSALYPEKVLQEREIGGVYFLAKHGLGLLPQLLEVAKAACPQHKLVYL